MYLHFYYMVLYHISEYFDYMIYQKFKSLVLNYYLYYHYTHLISKQYKPLSRNPLLLQVFLDKFFNLVILIIYILFYFKLNHILLSYNQELFSDINRMYMDFNQYFLELYQLINC